ncbi:MAG: nucleotidyl transferase AbiEii/AbiGii toxin family protein [Tenericutes bacterium]|nr:nucleotidyl transferase AbiEii/AbiGii toxin family protein [Mycoplasmatota bacterium]
MINDISFSAEWLKKINDKYKRADKNIIEKEIYALKLLELIAKTGFKFIFRGGTALSLMLQEFTRFSIDIDICTGESHKRLEEIIEILRASKFFSKITKSKEKSKATAGIDKLHYQFHYLSKLTEEDNFVVLDVVFDKNSFEHTKKIPIKYMLIKTESPYIEVVVPTLEELLIDKLTAFAPETIGITYKSKKYIEIIKQMYDITKVSDKIKVNELKVSTYKLKAQKQAKWRNLNIDYIETLKDSIKTALNIISDGYFSTENNEKLKNAIASFSGYIHTTVYTLSDAYESAIKVLYISTILLFGGFEVFNKKITKISLKDVDMLSKNFLNIINVLAQDNMTYLLESAISVIQNEQLLIKQ